MRITNHIRDKIQDALIEHAFAARNKAMKAREHDIGLKLYRTVVPEALERAVDKLNEQALESGLAGTFTHTIGYVYANRDGERNLRQISLTHSRPWTCRYNPPQVDLPDDHELTAEYDTLNEDAQVLQAEINKAEAEIAATLAPIYTAKTLRAVWPEVMSIAEPILVAAGMQPKAQPLVVATESLNVTLGLPAEVEEELEAA